MLRHYIFIHHSTLVELPSVWKLKASELGLVTEEEAEARADDWKMNGLMMYS